MAVQYYAQHLEEYNAEYALQMKEFKEGNLLFEIMERKVWSVSASDTAGLRKYYNEHRSKYNWKKSADALMVNTSDSLTAVKTRKQISAKPSAWRKITEDAQGNIMADSGRVEWSQIPAVSTSIAPGLLTKVVVNEDRTASFTYVIKTYTQTSPRSFQDARGLVMNDYQLEIEEKWIAELKKKYPVKVDENVLQTIVK
jgi:peptidyl-prolyl cis-trans isomerase SurA